MQVTLNVDKQSFCFIGNYSFSFGEPGPVEIDVVSLSKVEVDQFAFSYRQGYLIIDNPQELLRQVQPITPAIREIRKPILQILPAINNSEPILDPIKKETVEMRKVLSMKIPAIKHRAMSMTQRQVRNLLEVEKSFRNRKNLVSFLEELIQRHTDSVTGSVIMKQGDVGQSQDISSETAVRGKMSVREYLEHIGDIVDSEAVLITVGSQE